MLSRFGSNGKLARQSEDDDDDDGGRSGRKWTTMEMIQLILFLLLTNVFCLEGDKRTSQIKCAESNLIEDILTRIARKPAPPTQYLKKNTAARRRAARKLQRFQTFVGLMGKRN
ncbi:uncharacterized protein LOC133479920 [Phyllopteryx taeniolatus]|uniref:uncharacterized protein LOC133479920 n=1 Tax=Phyllopteryx taeniolatus TaxID=161469 RepID=UPI002AD3AFA6|nr:uncharacterized protein LOC133479920 [Phyllopteryx taeniolatus]